MTNVVRMYETGSPGNLRDKDMEVGEPGLGQVRIHRVAVGLKATGSSIVVI